MRVGVPAPTTFNLGTAHSLPLDPLQEFDSGSPILRNRQLRIRRNGWARLCPHQNCRHKISPLAPHQPRLTLPAIRLPLPIWAIQSRTAIIIRGYFELFELTVDNALEYATARGLIDDPAGVEVRELTGGISNSVIMLTGPSGCLVLKQPFRFLRVEQHWEIDRARVWHEVAAIRIWTDALGDKWAPQILHEDHDCYLYAMSCAPAGAMNWKDQLLAGDIQPATAQHAGRVLGHVHRLTTRRRSIDIVFPRHGVFVQGRVDPYFWPIINAGGPLAGPLKDLSERLLTRRLNLVHGDFSPKNILVADDHIFIIDFEISHYGDPSFDPAFIICHLILKAFYRFRQRDRYLALAREFWTSYLQSYGDFAPPDIESTTITTLGGLLVGRMDGKSPVEYISDDARRDSIRNAATRILLDGVSTLESTIEILEDELTSMESKCPPSHP